MSKAIELLEQLGMSDSVSESSPEVFWTGMGSNAMLWDGKKLKIATVIKPHNSEYEIEYGEGIFSPRSKYDTMEFLDKTFRTWKEARMHVETFAKELGYKVLSVKESKKRMADLQRKFNRK